MVIDLSVTTVEDSLTHVILKELWATFTLNKIIKKGLLIKSFLFFDKQIKKSLSADNFLFEYLAKFESKPLDL